VKIATSLEKINSLGGLNFIYTEFEQLKLPKFITYIKFWVDGIEKKENFYENKVLKI
jgi:hypothetical protein